LPKRNGLPPLPYKVVDVKVEESETLFDEHYEERTPGY